jgi:hypothetical protein
MRSDPNCPFFRAAAGRSACEGPGSRWPQPTIATRAHGKTEPGYLRDRVCVVSCRRETRLANLAESGARVMPIMVRRRRFSTTLASAIAGVVFLVSLVLGAYCLDFLWRVVVATVGLETWECDLATAVVAGVAIVAGAVILASALARYVFGALRWKQVEYDGGYCLQCDYDLAGNKSGVCPECGEPTIGRC